MKKMDPGVLARGVLATASAAVDDMRLLPLTEVGYWPQFERSEIVTETVAKPIVENVARQMPYRLSFRLRAK